MSVAPIIHAIQERLHGADYTDLTIPFKVAGVEFAFTAAMRGHDGRALDLVLVVDTTTGGTVTAKAQVSNNVSKR